MTPVSVQENIERHLAGGVYRPSRGVLLLLASDPVAGKEAADRERAAQARAAVKHGERLIKNRHGNSKYVPHQGARECARRAGRGW